MQEQRPDVQMRKGIWASIIAFFIIYILIQPILRAVWSGIQKIGPRILSRYIDSIYRNAAFGQRNEVDIMLLILIISLILGVFSGVGFSLWRRISPPEKAVKKDIKQSIKTSLILYWIIVGIFSVTSILIIVTPFVSLQLNTTFQQRLKIIAPKVTELELKELEAEWALMNSRADYETVASRIELIAKDNEIELPKPLIK